MSDDVFQLCDDSGRRMDARFEVIDRHVIVHSRGGAKGSGALNADYTPALLAMLERLQRHGVPVLGAWVDSSTVQMMPLEERSILPETERTATAQRMLGIMSARMKDVRADQPSKARGGNSTKRIRIATGFAGPDDGLIRLLGGVPVGTDLRSRERLPAATLERATPEFVWCAVRSLADGKAKHRFGPSTDFDLVADEDLRLPPKAVFGVALSLALGEPVLPKHFTGGEGSACFRMLRLAGFPVVRKGTSHPLNEPEDDTGGAEDSQNWKEGGKHLAIHLKSERARGLSQAKKDQQRRQRGRLICERCGLDPVGA